MSTALSAKHYDLLEEKWNIATHMLGLVMSGIALIALVHKSSQHDGLFPIMSFTVFGLSLVALYAASVFYHRASEAQLRSRLRIVDHAAIYILIAGTYTPFALLTLQGKLGWLIFISAWVLALIGIVLKLFFTGRYKRTSTILYVVMGWLILLFIKPLQANLSILGVYWLAAGGVAYTFGAVLYSIKKIRFNHAIFHVFVLLGSICHFNSVYFYVLPS